MTDPKIDILGAYKLEFSEAQVMQLILDDWGDTLTEHEKQSMLILKVEELSSVVAFDVRVSNADNNFDAGDFTQPGSDQVAWDEIYLSLDGHSVESHSLPLDPTHFRIYFYLHDIDLQKSLLSSYGEHIIPKLEPLPENLRNIHPYRMID